MTSRERMKAALTGARTDHAPFFPTIFIDHACAALGHAYEEALVDPRAGIRWMVEAGFLYGCDAVRVRQTPPRSWFKEKIVRQKGDCLIQEDRRSGKVDGYFDVQGGGGLIPSEPPAPAKTLEQVRALTFSSADEIIADGSLDTAREMTQKAHERGHFVIGMAGGQTINYAVIKVGDSGEMLERMATDPEFTHAIFRVATDASIELIRAYARIGVDGVYIGDSYASGSVISPRMYEDFCIPCYSRAADAAHAEGLLVYKHCCGNYTPLLHLINGNHLDGMEGMDPTRGMTVAATKAATGGSICLIGGVSCLSLLNATAEEVYAESASCIRQGGSHGRFVLGSACAVPRLSPVENLHAMARAARETEA